MAIKKKKCRNLATPTAWFRLLSSVTDYPVCGPYRRPGTGWPAKKPFLPSTVSEKLLEDLFHLVIFIFPPSKPPRVVTSNARVLPRNARTRVLPPSISRVLKTPFLSLRRSLLPRGFRFSFRQPGTVSATRGRPAHHSPIMRPRRARCTVIGIPHITWFSFFY